jgi:hypothetical protein
MVYIHCIFDSPPSSFHRFDRGEKLWKETGGSEEAYDEALRAISEAEAKMALAVEVHKE